MLRLQQYEKLLKALLRETSFTSSVSSDRLPTVVRHNQADDKTLGVLVQAFLGSVIKEKNQLKDRSEEIATVQQERISSFSSQFSIVMEPEQRVSVATALKELVEIRNGLVHHFIDQFDVWSMDGCNAAFVFLQTTLTLIDARFDELQGWAKSLDSVRKQTADFVSSSVFDDVLNGIEPDGTILWDQCGAVRVLSDAAEQLGSPSWTPLAEAIGWIERQHPEQTPERYRCKSWREVIHRSRLLKVEYLRDAGESVAGFRKVAQSGATVV